MTLGMVVEKKTVQGTENTQGKGQKQQAIKLGRIENKEEHRRLISNLFLVSGT